MQDELELSHPELPINIVGINRSSDANGNAGATQGRDIPWLQDLDEDNDRQSDVWAEWEVVWRDVIIVDGVGDIVETINLSSFNLQDPDNYDELKQVLIESTPPLESLPGDCSGDNVVDASDLDCVSDVQQRDIVLDAIGSLPGDVDGDGTVSFTDFLALSRNFGADSLSYTSGNIDMQGGIDFSDFLALSANFGKVPQAAAADAALEAWG